MLVTCCCGNRFGRILFWTFWVGMKGISIFFWLRYPAHIEDIDYEEGKVLIHFKRWNHRYDEWFCWDSPYLRPLEKIQLRKEGLHEEDGSSVSNKSGGSVMIGVSRWAVCVPACDIQCESQCLLVLILAWDPGDLVLSMNPSLYLFDVIDVNSTN